MTFCSSNSPASADRRYSLCLRLTILLLFFSASLVGCASMTTDEDFSGVYKVKGECAYRTPSGEYKDCEAWNELLLRRKENASTYTFSLNTNTFATTQGSCFLEGELALAFKSGKLLLTPLSVGEDDCHFSLEVTSSHFVLHVPKSEMFDRCKTPYCGHNSTLYSDPFPRINPAIQ